MHVMLLALVLLVFNCFHIHFYVVRCFPILKTLAKVTIYMIYIEPLFLHVNFKPTNHDRAI